MNPPPPCGCLTFRHPCDKMLVAIKKPEPVSRLRLDCRYASQISVNRKSNVARRASCRIELYLDSDCHRIRGGKIREKLNVAGSDGVAETHRKQGLGIRGDCREIERGIIPEHAPGSGHIGVNGPSSSARAHGLARITAVRPRGPFGCARFGGSGK